MSLMFLSGPLDLGCRQTRAGRRGELLKASRIFLLLVLVLALPSSWAKEAAPVAEDPEIERRMIHLSEDLRCLVCQNESLAGSRADFANDLRREIREQMRANKSDKEIIDFLVARYGDFVLYRPPVKSTTLFLWFGPFIFLAIGAVLLVVYLKRRRRQIEDPVLSEHQREQAEALLKEGKGNNA
ncbi:cytochrome c-type biogenesis protein [Nitrosospira sp. NpAV]|uniref:cytochrome c-type biogenesis protein n=1 Tax=Nitrosospira sp. NpAV TaxID=58133 RepID=UPI000A4A1F18|nr:cytochrome c-type biogenesis protein [Nitrosospira sp. NpAV]